MTTSSSTPGLLSAPRLTTLVTSLLVSLSSGTNYVYSAWAPQLGSRLRLTHTQLNMIGLAGNVGVYSSGPVWGRIVDSRGPRIPLTGAFVLLFTGYSAIKYFFDAGLPQGAQTMTTFSFCLLVVFYAITGAGGNGGLTSAVNSTAKTFPDKARATATGLVIGGFGLSAFMFSTVAHVAYAGNTSAFLQLLALGTALPMILGYFFVRPIPLPSEAPPGSERGLGANNEGVTSTSALIDDPHTRLLDHDVLAVELNVSEDQLHHFSQEHTRSRSSASHSSSALAHADRGYLEERLPNVFGAELWKSGGFWLLFTILSISSGTGLMYINNVGAMSQILYARNNSHYDGVEAARLQALQVSTISIMSFLGRIAIGIISDTAKNKFSLPRSYCLVLVSTSVFLSQVTAANIDEISNLWLASAILGFSYGSVFSLLPLMCIEWFGLPHFSENWGYLSMAPMVAGNIFMMFFGRNLDAHESKPHSQQLSARAAANPNIFSPLPSAITMIMRKTAGNGTETEIPQCLEGKECYIAALRLTMVMTFLCILLSFWAARRDRRRLNDVAGESDRKGGVFRRSRRVSRGSHASVERA